MLLIITGTGDGLFRFININDLERPWTPKKGFLVNFSQFLAEAHILRMNCDVMAGDGPKQPGNEIFALNSGKHQRGLPPKKWLFYCY